MVHDYSKLHGRIVEKFKNISNFAKYIGVAPSTVSEKLNGTKPLTNRDVDKWAGPLGIPLEEIGYYFFA